MKIELYVYRDLSPMPQSEHHANMDNYYYTGYRRLQMQIENAKMEESYKQLILYPPGILAEIETLTNNND